MKKLIVLFTLFACVHLIKAQQFASGGAVEISNFNTVLKTGIYNSYNSQEGYPEVYPDRCNNLLFVMRNGDLLRNRQFQLATSCFEQTDRVFFRKIYIDELTDRNTPWYELATRGSNKFIGNQIVDGALEVAGTIRAQEVKIENTNWPDYVFSKDYQLPSLSEVSKHIEENKHLPGIPSAKEVEENGVNLSEMNAKLLQKIEELTLYVIDQNKKMEALEREIKEMKRNQ